MSKDDILYLEKHHLPKWAWLIILPIALLFWWILVKQIVFGLPVGSKPMSDSGTITKEGVIRI